MYSELARSVVASQYYSSSLAFFGIRPDDERRLLELRVLGELARGIERVHVNMEYYSLSVRHLKIGLRASSFERILRGQPEPVPLKRLPELMARLRGSYSDDSLLAKVQGV